MAHLVGPFWVVKVKQVCIIRSNLIVNCQAVQVSVDIKKLLKLHQFLLEIYNNCLEATSMVNGTVHVDPVRRRS